jgi:hypothetical protein
MGELRGDEKNSSNGSHVDRGHAYLLPARAVRAPGYSSRKFISSDLEKYTHFEVRVLSVDPVRGTAVHLADVFLNLWNEGCFSASRRNDE